MAPLIEPLWSWSSVGHTDNRQIKNAHTNQLHVGSLKGLDRSLKTIVSYDSHLFRRYFGMMQNVPGSRQRFKIKNLNKISVLVKI